MPENVYVNMVVVQVIAKKSYFCEKNEGLSGSSLDSRLRVPWFDSYIRHCAVSLSKTLNPLFSTGSTQKKYRHDLLAGTESIKTNKQTLREK